MFRTLRAKNPMSLACAVLLALGLSLSGCTEDNPNRSGSGGLGDSDIEDGRSGADTEDTGSDADPGGDSGDPQDAGDTGETPDAEDPMDTGDAKDPGDAADTTDPADAADAADPGDADGGGVDSGDVDSGSDADVPAPECTTTNDCSPRTNTNVECVDDTCEYTCVDGYDSCDGDTSTGCEINTTSDLDHCGGCGQTCDPANATAMCTLGSCELDDCADGFVNLNDDPADGCECEITNANDIPDSSANDSNCDGIDGDLNNSVFVSEQNGDATNDGLTPQTPVATITQGIAIAGQQDPAFEVLVAEGSYDEYVTLESGVDVYGGYSSSGWAHDTSQNQVTIQPSGDSPEAGQNRTVIADGLDNPTVLDGVTVYGADSQAAGASSFAVWVRDSGGHLSITYSSVIAGEGGDGANGDNGQPVASGMNGQNAQGNTGAATNDTGCSAGGAGGSATSACSSNTGEDGAAGATSASGGDGGLAGDNYCRQGWNDSCENTVGADGVDGQNGQDGQNGGAGSNGYGFFTGADVWHGDVGPAASNGEAGGGGGGGGGGGSCSGSFIDASNGGGGGAGGSGGCGGEAATNGRPGGGSVGLLLLDSTVALQSVDITMSVGGDGGGGGNGSTGRTGGAGGLGDPRPNSRGAAGGDGGIGGEGGVGGNGAGGCGGPSIGVATVGTGQISGSSVYTIDTSSAAAGTAGGGGTNQVGSAPQGCTGEVADEHSF